MPAETSLIIQTFCRYSSQESPAEFLLIHQVFMPHLTERNSLNMSVSFQKKFIKYLDSPGLTLGYFSGENLPQPMLIPVCWSSFNPKQNLVCKYGEAV